MGNRPYAQINCTLTQSKKMRGLSGPLPKWAYICAHLSELGDYTGLFRYPLSVWADDAQVPSVELTGAIEELCQNGLIEYDFDAQLCRIVSWFHKKNAPENASRMQSLVYDLHAREVDNPEMLMRSVAELAVGSVKRAQRWKETSVEWPKLRDAFRPFLMQFHLDYGDVFLDVMSVELEATGKAVSGEVGALLPALTLRAPCPHLVATVGPHVQDTRRDEQEIEKRKDEKNTGAQNVSSDASQPMKKVNDEPTVAMKSTKLPGPLPNTIASAKRMGALN